MFSLTYLFAHNHSTKTYHPLSFILFFVYDHSTKIRVLIYLFLLFVHDHSTKLFGPLSFILFLFRARPFDQKLGSLSFILSFFGARPFEQKLGSSLIYSFHLYTTIRPKIKVPTNLMLLFLHDYLTKNWGPH